MNKPPRAAQDKLFPRPAQQMNGLNQTDSRIVQPKLATSAQQPKWPVAPPVYRPQPVPKVLQRKMAVGQPPQKAELGRTPVAPPVYRPQPKQIQPPQPAQARPAMKVGGANALQAKAVKPPATAQPKKPAHISPPQVRTPGQSRVAQLKQHPAPPSVGRTPVRNATIQAKWTFDVHGAPPPDTGRAPIDTTKLPRLNINSNFKDFYDVNGKLLAVFKNHNSSDLVKSEEMALFRIRLAGFDTANPEIVPVIHKDSNGQTERTQGILMDKVQGAFVDMAKKEAGAIFSILDSVARGGAVNDLEIAPQNLGQQVRPQNKKVVDNMIKGLSTLLEKQDAIAINDLQFMVKPDGQFVIIDPQWAGPKQTLTKQQEKEFIAKTYERVKTVKEQLEKEPKQAPSFVKPIAPMNYGSGRNMLDLSKFSKKK